MENDNIPVFVHESMLSRQERTIRRLWVLCIIIFVALVGTNAGWIYYESQWVDESYEMVETSTDGGGDAYGNLISGDNSEVHYGEGQGNED